MKNLLLFILFLFLDSFLTMKAVDKNKGDFSNLVVFLRFADEDEEVFLIVQKLVLILYIIILKKHHTINFFGLAFFIRRHQIVGA